MSDDDPNDPLYIPPKAAAPSRSLIEAQVKSRVRDICLSTEGKGNPELALSLALDSELSADAAKDILARAPTSSPYVQAMQRETIGITGAGNPDAAAMTGDKRAARIAEIRRNVPRTHP